MGNSPKPNTRAKGYNIITFGAPGTGKSYSVKNVIKEIFEDRNGLQSPNETDLDELPEGLAIRTTFHPDSDYSTFIGCYKPEMDGKDVVYGYSAQPLVQAYVNAWKTLDPYFLIVEEINRGNCAQIFGDTFQILDRKTDGEHEYSIKPDADLQKHLASAFMTIADSVTVPEEIRNGSKMYLPKNLTILATMNTSDQSLFPMDSAFKRRWEWRYQPITDGGKNRFFVVNSRRYDWWEFLQKINQKIYEVTESEDKKLGYWFVKVEDGEPITTDMFVSKVIFYLWTDVFKDYGKLSDSPFTFKSVEQADGSEKKTKEEYKTFNDFFDPISGKALGNMVEDFLIKGLGLQIGIPYIPGLADNTEGDSTEDDTGEDTNESKKNKISFNELTEETIPEGFKPISQYKDKEYKNIRLIAYFPNLGKATKINGAIKVLQDIIGAIGIEKVFKLQVPGQRAKDYHLIVEKKDIKTLLQKNKTASPAPFADNPHYYLLRKGSADEQVRNIMSLLEKIKENSKDYENDKDRFELYYADK